MANRTPRPKRPDETPEEYQKYLSTFYTQLDGDEEVSRHNTAGAGRPGAETGEDDLANEVLEGATSATVEHGSEMGAPYEGGASSDGLSDVERQAQGVGIEVVENDDPFEILAPETAAPEAASDTESAPKEEPGKESWNTTGTRTGRTAQAGRGLEELEKVMPIQDDWYDDLMGWDPQDADDWGRLILEGNTEEAGKIRDRVHASRR